MFDVVVVGGGVIGGLILRELAKYQLKVCLLEKESDVCMGASKANSGIVHAGYDAPNDSLKAKFNVEGNQMMEELCKELGVKFYRNGSLVVAFLEEEIQVLKTLKERGEKNGVKGLEIVDKLQLKAMEKNLSNVAIAALYAPTSGIVCPYTLTIAAIGNAMDNGARLMTDFEVLSIENNGENYAVKSSDGQIVYGKLIINAAGLNSGKIAAMVGDEITIGARKGEYILLDRESGDFVSHTLFFTPTSKGKGILVTRTADNNLMLGPTSEEQENADKETSTKGLTYIMEKASKMTKNPPFFDTITSFAGIRAYSSKHDFIIEESEKAKGVIHCAGIESPGLSAAPAIAKYVVETLVSKHIKLKKNNAFNGHRKADDFFKKLSSQEKNELIKKEPSYGKIVCRCEQVTEGEILHAIRQNPPAKDVDGVKRRTRTGMGRCQGGFCQPYVAELLAKEQGIGMEEVTKCGKGSRLLIGVTK